MNKFKLLIGLLLALFPVLVLAQQNSLSFTPPPGDYSVIFLGNIFGIVDGVLHGTGSQIMGSMFGVFNAAVLALGGIIIMYTLMVSTMNTAHEGQMLGRKWSEIWVPLRATLGLALLIPKASGYCLIQIFVMWIVVQGIGAADKIWGAALSYLNRGGVIVQAQMAPKISLTSDENQVVFGASNILTGQVCMLGLQTALTNQQQAYLAAKQKNSGPCAGSPSSTMQQFCETPVPNFIASFDAVGTQSSIMSSTPGDTSYTVPMPNFPADSPYNYLNGICGSVTWNAYTAAGDDTLKRVENAQKIIPTLTDSEYQTMLMSRAIGVQQMYSDLATVAQVMVNNDPQINPPDTNDSTTTSTPDFPSAMQQFGIPTLASGKICTSASADCTNWGPDPSAANADAPLLDGTELQDAVTDYNGIMAPTVRLINEMKHKNLEAANAERKFIQTAENQGWIMAGSYFINLASINASTLKQANATDINSGLNGTTATPSNLTSPFGPKGQCNTQSQYINLCTWLNGDMTPMTNIIGLVDGSTFLNDPPSAPNWQPFNLSPTIYSGPASSTVYGYLSNATVLRIPGQPGLSNPPQFHMNFNFKFDPYQLKPKTFACNGFSILGKQICIGEYLSDAFYNDVFVKIFNFFVGMFSKVINMVLMALLSIPLQGMKTIFINGMQIIQQPNVNPVIALANMGVTFINWVNELWIDIIMISLLTYLLPVVGKIIVPLILLAMPLLMAWMSVMAAIGFITAYYVPFLPYMIFTFGSIAWIMVVIEAMVAAPIVALGVTHPEGEGPFGKGEQAIMLLMNVFLRPAMMIIGYIAGIALSYVVVWIINAGFANVADFIQGSKSGTYSFQSGSRVKDIYNQASNINMQTGYTGWAGIYGFFFAVVVYTMMYVTAVQKSFSLITVLPDKILRWIQGGQAEQLGQEVTQWTEDTKGQVRDTGKETKDAQAQVEKKAAGAVGSVVQKGQQMLGGGGSTDVSAGPGSTPSSPEE